MSKTYSHDDLLTLLRKRIAEAGSLRKWADANGISSAHVSNVSSGKELRLGVAIPAALGFQQHETLYVKVR